VSYRNQCWVSLRLRDSLRAAVSNVVPDWQQQLECQLLRFIGFLGKYNFPVQLGIL